MRKGKGTKGVVRLKTPIQDDEIRKLKVGDQIEIDGRIYCGRDAVLPKLVGLVEKNDLDRIKVELQGAVIFHTAVSPAGIGPTTSNKVEIEGSIPTLSEAGVKIHLGKGSLSSKTVGELKKYTSVFAVTPPATALFSDKMISQRVAAFKKEGMEALYEVKVAGFPAIVAIAHGKTIFSRPTGGKGLKHANSKQDKSCRRELPDKSGDHLSQGSMGRLSRRDSERKRQERKMGS
jgi:fumarate hydratase subunit beta